MRIRLAAALLALAVTCTACGQTGTGQTGGRPDSASGPGPLGRLPVGHARAGATPTEPSADSETGSPAGAEANILPFEALTPADCAPPVIAHRGEGGNPADYPENTSLSELDAARHGANVLNMDVRWTADAVPVALHDPTVDRTTSGSGPILALTAAQYTALDSRDNSGRVRAGWHPQTLAEVLAAVRPTGLPIVIQIEADPFDGTSAALVPRSEVAESRFQSAELDFSRFARTIEQSGYAGKVIVAGWTQPDLLAFHAVAPAIRTAYLQNAGDPAADAILATGARILYLEYTAVTAARVAAWHRAGIAVWAWTPPAAADWTALARDRVDAIATNWVPSYVHWAQATCPVAWNG
jgi:glycerophosphoryl diester phosphodiesterase